MEQCNKEKCSQPMIVSITSSTGIGTGFFVRENLIATNIHCIAGATSASARLLDSNTEYDVEGIVAFDDKNDLVILKVSGIGTPFPIGNGDILKKGEVVKAVGCISGKYVTAEGEFQSYMNKGQWLHTTAKTINGYSGGPLLDGKGFVIGVNFGGGDYYSDAISSTILEDLLSKTHTIELLAQWQTRKQIKSYDYLVESKRKICAKNYDDAITYLDKTIRQNPGYIMSYIIRGEAKHSLAESKIDEEALVEAQQLLRSAIDDFTEAIRLCPDISAAYKARGTAKSDLSQSITVEGDSSEKQQLLKCSIDDFNEAIRLSPVHVDAYNSRADAQLHLAKSESDSGNVEKAHNLFQAALTDVNIVINENKCIPIEKDLDVAVCYHTRGEIKEAMGDLSAAKDDFKEVSQNTEYVKESKISDDLKRVQDILNQQN